jgi:hypothetical protein
MPKTAKITREWGMAAAALPGEAREISKYGNLPENARESD